jgi:hypothetical protein
VIAAVDITCQASFTYQFTGTRLVINQGENCSVKVKFPAPQPIGNVVVGFKCAGAGVGSRWI